MNEVRTTPPVVQLVANRQTSSQGSPALKDGAGQSGKVLPKTVPAEVKDAQDAQKLEKSLETKPSSSVEKKEEVQHAVAQMNDYVQSIQRDLQFHVDDELSQTVVKVVDRDTGDLIRQIPEEVFLELARKLNEDGEVRLLNALG